MADVIVRSLTYKPTGSEIEPSPTATMSLLASVPDPEGLRSGHKIILTDENGDLSETYLPAYLSRTSVGALEDLTTTAKTSLVAAINEAASTGSSGAANIDDTTTSLTTVYSSSKVAELLAAKATNGLDYVATYETGDFNTLDFSRVGLYRVRGGTGYVTNLPSTSAQWWHVAVLYTQSPADANTTMMLATSSTSNTAYYRARYGNTWGSWLAWTTYSSMSVAEGTAGTATSSRVLRADYLKQIILTYLTGSGTTSATPLGQALVTVSDGAAARTLIGAVATEDPRLSDARTPTAHTHVWADLTDKPTTFAPAPHVHVVGDVTGLQTTLTDLQTAVDGKVSTSDPRLTDARTPVAHTHPVTDLTATGRTTSNYLRGDGTWATPTNTTYSNISTAEITSSGTTGRIVTGDLLKQAVRYWTTGSLTTANSAFGQSLNTAADAAAARTVLGAVADTDPRLTDARTPTAHTHAVADVTGLQAALDGKASTTHSHDWASITSKPTTFAPAAHVHDLDDLNISGTPSATTYLRGDGTWATPAGTGGTQGGDITSTQILDSTNVGRAVLTAATAEAARTAIGAGTSDLVIGTAATEAKAGNWVPTWADVTSKPATYPPDAHTHTAAQISDATTTGRSVLTAANASAARTAIGAGTSNLAIGTTSSTAKVGDWVPAWTDVTGKPTTFTPAAHTHLWVDITDKPTSFTPVAHTHAIADVTGLQTALDGKAASTHTHTIANVTGLQTALDGKAPASHTHLWAELTDKPTTFPPSTHTHVWADITNPPATYTPTAHTHVAADISDSTTVGRSVLTATDAAAARTAIGAGTSSLVIGTTASTAKAGNYVPAWSEITSKPTTFPPEPHTHSTADLSNATSLGRSLLGDSTPTAMRSRIGAEEADNPIPSFLWHDVLTFGRKVAWPDYETTTDGVTWTDANSNRATYDPLFIGKEGLSVYVVPSNDPIIGWRATWKDGVAWSNLERWIIGFAYTGTSQIKDIVVESSPDSGTTWTERFRDNGNNANARPYTFRHDSLGGDGYLRLTFLTDGTSPVRLSGIRALSRRWGDQGGGIEYTLPYGWDENRKIMVERLRVAKDSNGNTLASGDILMTGNAYGDIVGTRAEPGNIPDTLVKRNSNGQIAIGDPTSDGHAVTRKFVTDNLAGKVDTTDARLSDARTPVAHKHPVGDITPTGGTASSTTYLRGDGQWATPTNTTYSTPATSEITTGTATTARTITADLLKQAVRFWVTGSLTTAVTAFGSSIVTAADAAAARTLLGAVSTTDPRLSDARTPTAHTHVWADITDKPTTFTPSPHTHTASQISDSTATGRSVLTATDAAAARTAIGAGTSNLALGTTSSTAKAGDYTPTWTEVSSKPATFPPSTHSHVAADITDSTATGRSVLTAASAAAARTAIGAGTSDLAIGTTASTAKAGNYQPTAANISDSTTIGRSIVTAADAAAVRTAIDAAQSSHTHGVGDVTNLQTLLDAKAPKASGLLGTGLPWYSQAVVNSGALADGYNDLKGGLMADRDVVLESMVFWLEEPASTIGGTGNLQIQWYAGSVTAQETTLIQTTQLPAGQHDIWVVLATPTNYPINTVFRPKITLGTTTVTGACHVQFRGRYQ